MLYTDAQKDAHIEEILGMLYQIALRDSRIPIVIPDSGYTEEAALAVRAYQSAYGLPVTGEIDGDTWDSIVQTSRELTETAAPLVLFPAGGFVLQTGDTGGLVELVQVLLRLAGRYYANLPVIEATGTYDAETTTAVRILQQIAALPVTGITNRDTWNALAVLTGRLPLSI